MIRQADSISAWAPLEFPNLFVRRRTMYEPWHGQEAGVRYHRDKVVADCEGRIADGGVIRVEGKQRLVGQIRDHAPDTIVWTPFGRGWGRSPFNPNCWKTVDGEPVLPADIVVPELEEPDEEAGPDS
jgi:hypothetical protein